MPLPAPSSQALFPFSQSSQWKGKAGLDGLDWPSLQWRSPPPKSASQGSCECTSNFSRTVMPQIWLVLGYFAHTQPEHVWNNSFTREAGAANVVMSAEAPSGDLHTARLSTRTYYTSTMPVLNCIYTLVPRIKYIRETRRDGGLPQRDARCGTARLVPCLSLPYPPLPPVCSRPHQTGRPCPSFAATVLPLMVAVQLRKHEAKSSSKLSLHNLTRSRVTPVSCALTRVCPVEAAVRGHDAKSHVLHRHERTTVTEQAMYRYDSCIHGQGLVCAEATHPVAFEPFTAVSAAAAAAAAATWTSSKLADKGLRALHTAGAVVAAASRTECC
ncbi:hypothetical protein CCMA1212_007170 [Trichoderma ghanense]|uniref:Uncharacterized protein n=1 Tax=Trichoderma ghanense TaxID=65468 RepID=A0ABY2GYV5_9HYPO